MAENIIVRKAEKKDCQSIFDLSRALAKHHDLEQYVTIKYEDFEQFGFGENPAWWAYIAENNHQIVGWFYHAIRNIIHMGNQVIATAVFGYKSA